MSQPSTNLPTTTTPSSSNTSSRERRKPRISLAIATAFGLGYLPKAPGTWGSLGGVAISLALHWWLSQKALQGIVWQVRGNFWTIPLFPESTEYVIVILFGLLGVYVADRAAKYTGKKDPQFVVVDEVSGQMITYFSPLSVLNWKTWLLGFILFRVFDIWKPFPARQAESLPGGWGIMADDWIAGIYAALGMWAVRALGL
ncbi:MAG: phosphatidylglycerophosphatase A [Candidatus Acidiferrales bacterium]|jgi:phosphatidylglycerophosphatase A